MIGKIERLRYWCHKVLPLVYDDSLSYYELLCKVVAKLNEMAETVNDLADIYNAVEDKITEMVKVILDKMVEDGTLGELINDALLTTKVDRYKAKFYAIGYANTGNNRENLQDCFVVKLNGKAMLIDTGYKASTAQIVDICNREGITKFDYIYISHYHEDHAENFDSIASVIDIRGAKVFLPPAPNPAYASSRVMTCYNMVLSICAINGCTTVVPSEGEIFDLTTKETIQFFNTNHSIYENENYDYNDCSLCAAIGVLGSLVWFDGDLSKTGQKAIASIVPKNVLAKKMSHHGTTPSGYEPYFDNLNAQYVFATDGNGNSNDLATNNLLSAWGYETTYLDRLNIPTFATSVAPSYIMVFEVGERYFNSLTPRYPYKRINPRNTSTASIVEGYTSAVRDLYLVEIIDKMPDSYLEFHASASWKCCPDEYANGVFWRIWKNSSANAQGAYSLTDKTWFAIAIMTEHSNLGNSEDTNIISFHKSPSTNNEWVCSLTSGTLNFYACNFTGASGAGDSVEHIPLNNHKGNDIMVIGGDWQCTNIGYYKCDLYATVFGNTGDAYEIKVTRERDGEVGNLVVAKGVKQYDGEEYLYIASHDVLRPGDILRVARNTLDGCSFKVLVHPLSYGWNVGREDFLTPP